MLEEVGLVWVASLGLALAAAVVAAAVEANCELIFASKKVTSKVASSAITPRYCHNRLDNELNDDRTAAFTVAD